MNEVGIFYVATGKKYLEEAIISHNSLKENNKDIPVKLYTDKSNSEFARKFFTDIEIIDNPKFNFQDKIYPFFNPPYNCNLFLDTDTYICSSITDIFEVLRYYQFGLIHAPGRIQYNNHMLPDYFPEFNTGFIAFNRNKMTSGVFKEWERIYRYQLQNQIPVPHDQPAFREALFQSKLSVFVFPNEYNFRINSPNFAGKNMKVKVLHGRVKDFKKVEDILNRNFGNARIFIHDLYFLSKRSFCSLNPFQNKSLIYNFILLLNQTYQKTVRNLGLSKTNEISKRKGN
jgi:hypothetical protein